MGIPYNMSVIDYVEGPATPTFEILSFTSNKSSDAILRVTHIGSDDPIWTDGTNTYQPAKVANISMVTFPWTDTSTKTVSVKVEDLSDQFAVEDFTGVGLLSVDLTLIQSVAPSNWDFSTNPGLTGISLIDGMDHLKVSYCTGLSSLDFTPVTNSMVQIHFNNTNISSVTFPADFEATNYCNFSNTPGFVGTLDLSNMISVGNFNCSVMSNVTEFITPIENGAIAGNFQFTPTGGTGISGAFDLSDMWLSNSLILNLGDNCTSVIFPDTSASAIDCSVSTSGATGFNLNSLTLDALTIVGHDSLTTVDISSVDNDGIDTFTFTSNTALEFFDCTLTNPIPDINDLVWEMQNNTFSTALVNQWLDHIDSLSDGLFTGRTLDISGDNDAPDSSSGGYDGDAAVTSLEGKGWTVTTN